MSQDDPILFYVLLLFIVVLAYFIPTWIANSRKHHNGDAIFATNLLLGWTFLGWVVALIWSLTAVNPESAKDKSLGNADSQSETKQCPFCAETNKKEAKVCRYCNRDLPEEPKESTILPILRV